MASEIDVETFTTYSDALQAAALSTTRLAATSLPEDLSFHRSIDPALAHDIDAFSERILALSKKLVYIATGKSTRIQEEEDVVDEFVRNIVDPMEQLLESTDSTLDVFLGKTKSPAIHVPAVPVDPRQNKPKKQQHHGRLDPALTHASHLPKPQLLFKHTVSNADESPYIPATLIPHKWCAKVPLGYVFHDERLDQAVKDDREDDDEEERRKRVLHPYYYELTHPSYPDHVYNPPIEPLLPRPLTTLSPKAATTTNPLTFVSTPKALLSMANAISSVTELAVDLEHHSYRSYKGFLALMQISTRQEDFVIDLLVPEIREGLRQGKDKSIGEDEETRAASDAGQIIARVFADPLVIKVFHGAQSDIVWLQQDFNIFVVGLFDTFHASKLLEFPKHSLAYLLETYCDFVPDKRYQLADWRIRPLPSEMLTYACSDTHFLLYIYDMLRMPLVERPSSTLSKSDETLSFTDTTEQHHERTLIHAVLARSSYTALRLYDIEVYDADSGIGSGGWNTLARKWNKIGLVGLHSQARGTNAQVLQAAVYKAVHRWREDVAREEDESTRYVLPTHHLFLLAERVPTTIPDLLSLFGGSGSANGSVPPVLKRRTGELAAIIKGATETVKPTFSPQRPAEDGPNNAEMTVSMVVEESEDMDLAVPFAPATNESRLWAVGSSSKSAATFSISRSFLFGSGISGDLTEVKKAAPPDVGGREELHSAAGSVLLGSALPKSTSAPSSTIKSTRTRTQVSEHSTECFKNLMEKIHRTLVIAPVVSIPSLATHVETQALETSLLHTPTTAQSNQCEPVVPEVPDPMSPGPAGQTEIPFVPAHKRQTLSNQRDHEIKDDTIVVVGQVGARQRKRKRDKARSIAPTSPSKLEPRSAGAEGAMSIDDRDPKMEEFDYSSIPNLLDDEGQHVNADARGIREGDEGKKKKQRRGKGPGFFEYGNFRPPPRDQREVTSGNKTHTFR